MTGSSWQELEPDWAHRAGCHQEHLKGHSSCSSHRYPWQWTSLRQRSGRGSFCPSQGLDGRRGDKVLGAETSISVGEEEEKRVAGAAQTVPSSSNGTSSTARAPPVAAEACQRPLCHHPCLCWGPCLIPAAVWGMGGLTWGLARWSSSYWLV